MFLIVYLNFLLFHVFPIHSIKPSAALSHKGLNPELLC